jgi:hypothetical protein
MDDTDLRDGPTESFKQHHDVTHRSTGAGGKRVETRLEQLMMTDWITPEQWDAGRRFGIDYVIAYDSRSRSCLDISVRGSADGLTESRHDAANRYDAAKRAVDSESSHSYRPSDVLLAFCLRDASFASIALTMGRSTRQETAKARIVKLLATLTVHYEIADKLAGRSSTPHTKKMALARIEPVEDEDQSS